MKRTRIYNFALAGLAFLPLVVMGISPIALNSGGAPAWSGGSFASVSTATTGCPTYSFSAESTLGFGRAGADELCIGSASAYVSIKHNSSKTQLQFNTAPSASTPHLAEVDNATTGFSVSDATNPFIWSESGTAKWTLHTSGGRTYLCVGAWNTNGIPCFTSSGSDFVMYDSDGSTFAGYMDLRAAPVYTSDGTAAAPAYVFDGGNTGLYRSGADAINLAIDGTNAGRLAWSDGGTIRGLSPEAGYYVNVAEVTADPSTNDCNASGENGRIVYDSTNHRLLVCNDQSGTRTDWDRAALTD